MYTVRLGCRHILLCAGRSVAQLDAIIHVNYNGEQAESKMFDFDQDDEGDIDIRTRIGDNMGTPSFVVNTGGPTNDHGWSFHLRADYGTCISELDEWTQYCYHEYLTQGPIHEDFLTAIRRELPDGGYCFGWLSYRVDAGDIIPGHSPEIGIITFYDYYYCTIPDHPFHVGQTDLNWNAVITENNIDFIPVPNPTAGRVLITGKDLKSATVYNTLGQHIATTQGEGNQLMVDLSDQQTGIYFVNVTDQEGRNCVRKVVKQ